MSERLRQSLYELEERILELKRENERLRQALQDISDPVRAIQRDTPEDRLIDWTWACRLAGMPSHLQEIARKALED